MVDSTFMIGFTLLCYAPMRADLAPISNAAPTRNPNPRHLSVLAKLKTGPVGTDLSKNKHDLQASGLLRTAANQNILCKLNSRSLNMLNVYGQP